jgi:hypothetical protein
MLRLMAMLGVDASGYELGMKRAESMAKKFATNVKSNIGGEIGGRIQDLFSLSSVESAIRATLQYAGHIQDLSDRVGVSTDDLQKWDFALMKAGASADTAATFFEALAKARLDALGGDEKAQSNFAKFGVSGADLRGKRLEELGVQIGNAFRGGDQQMLAAALREIGGKSATKLAAAFKAGLEEEFANAPLIKANDIAELDKLGEKFDILKRQLMSEFAPALAYVLTKLSEIAEHPSWRNFAQGMLGATPAGAAVNVVKALAELEASKNKAEEKPKNELPEPDKKTTDTARKIKRDEEEKAQLPQLGESRAASVNSLQQIGAQVLFTPMQSEMKILTQAVRENTRAVKGNKTNPAAPRIDPHVEY